MNNLNSRPNQVSHNPNQAPSDWDNLGENFEEEQRLREERKNELVNAVLYGPDDQEHRHDPITPDAEDNAFYALEGRNLSETRNKRSEFLQALAPSAVEINPDEVADQLRGNTHYERILTGMTGGDGNKPRPASAQDLQTFIQKYPTPVDFESTRISFLDTIGRANGPAKYNEYAEDMANFENAVYGERRAYFDALEDLEASVTGRNQQRATAAAERDRAENYNNLVASQRQLVEEVYQEGYHDDNPYAAPEMRSNAPAEHQETPKKKPGIFSRFFKKKA